MDWFEKLTGFRETGYRDTRDQLEVDGPRLRSLKTGASHGIGDLELVSLQALRIGPSPEVIGQVGSRSM